MWWPRTWTTLERVGLVVAFSVIAIAWYRPPARVLVTGGIMVVLLVAAGWRLHRKGDRGAGHGRDVRQRKNSVHVDEEPNRHPKR